MQNSAIIQKIQKLLSLANSDNENEAKAAASKAALLLTKHNLELQQIIEKNFEYGEIEACEIPQIKWHQHHITDLLQKYFFVKILFSRRWDEKRHRMRRTIQLVGTEVNCKIAAYVFSYLNDIYPRLWHEYKDDQYRKGNKLYKNHRDSYFTGLTVGIEFQLHQARFRAEEEFGLVVVKDEALEKHVDDITKGRTHKTSKKEFYHDVAADGHKAGLNVQLKKAITAEENESEVLFITAGE